MLISPMTSVLLGECSGRWPSTDINVSKMIDELVDVASAEKIATQDFLWGFVREQAWKELLPTAL